MDGSPHGIARFLLPAACVGLSLAASACKREEPRASDPPPAAEAADAGGAASTSAFTVDAADLPGPQASPLRLVFGSRGAGMAWVVERTDGIHVVHNGRTHRAVTAVDQISISPDGNRIAYGAQVDGTWRMIVDGEVAGPSNGVEQPVFSPDGRHLAYFASAGDNTKRLVVDRTEGPKRHGSVGAPVFSADSTLLAFADVAEAGQPARLSVSDVALAEVTVRSSGVKEFVANEARTAIAAVIQGGSAEWVVVLGFSRRGAVAKGQPYDAVSSLAFGPDGATVAYVAEKEGSRFLVLGGKKAPLPEGSVSAAPVIRPDGTGAGVLMVSGGGHFLHEAFAGGGGEGQRYEEAAELAYAADGRTKAFCARRGESWFVVANGKEGPPFDRVVSPTFSPDGRFLAYRARKEGGRFVVISDADGRTIRQLPTYEQVFPVRFTADGKSIAYGVKDGRHLAWKVERL